LAEKAWTACAGPVPDVPGAGAAPATKLYSDRSSQREKGFLDIEGRFELGAPLFEECTRLNPWARVAGPENPPGRPLMRDGRPGGVQPTCRSMQE
jgi:hypothetical protein